MLLVIFLPSFQTTLAQDDESNKVEVDLEESVSTMEDSPGDEPESKKVTLEESISMIGDEALVPRKPRSISKSSLLNLADTCVGKSLNKNKFVDVLGQETQRTDKMFHEPTLPSASAFILFSANSPCSTL